MLLCHQQIPINGQTVYSAYSPVNDKGGTAGDEVFKTILRVDF